MQWLKLMKKSSDNFVKGCENLVTVLQILIAEPLRCTVFSLFILANVAAKWQVLTLLFRKSKGENKSQHSIANVTVLVTNSWPGLFFFLDSLVCHPLEGTTMHQCPKALISGSS